MPKTKGTRAWLLVALVAFAAPPASTQDAPALRVAVGTRPQLTEWDGRIARMLAAGELRVRRVREDTMLPGRTHVRMTQTHDGVPVWGGELVRQLAGESTVSVFGTLYAGVDIDVDPLLSAAEAKRIVEGISGARLGPGRDPELVILPLGDGTYALTYRLRAVGQKDLRMYFIDASTGAVVHEYSDLKTQSAVGQGTGTLGDTKKMSTRSNGGSFVTQDLLRPPSIRTFDLRGDLFRTLDILNGWVAPDTSDLASDSDNEWTDGPSVDAHTYAGWTYDYFHRRFGRAGLDDHNIEIQSIVHPVNRDDYWYYVDNFDDWVVDSFFVNAAYYGGGVMVYGEGLPDGVYLRSGRQANYFSAGLDVVAHELTHGVTDFSSQLIYRNESGALNESFSDVMATGVEFMFQQAGSGLLVADYLVGEDIITPGGIRSLEDPASYGDPDHYSVRFTGTADNGGVHINSSISNHAFYLAIEGGQNRVSGLTVTGVGSANRERIESIFYRAFTLMLPSSATFATARQATIQAARDLHGAGSPEERAMTEAWTAVGVE